MPHQRHIMIVTPERNTNDFLSSVLVEQGYSVRAIAHNNALPPNIDPCPNLFIIDIDAAPQIALVTYAHATYTCPIVVIGPSHNAQLLVAALDSGADDYIQRPYRSDELLARVRVLMRRGGR